MAKKFSIPMLAKAEVAHNVLCPVRIAGTAPVAEFIQSFRLEGPKD